MLLDAAVPVVFAGVFCAVVFCGGVLCAGVTAITGVFCVVAGFVLPAGFPVPVEVTAGLLEFVVVAAAGFPEPFWLEVLEVVFAVEEVAALVVAALVVLALVEAGFLLVEVAVLFAGVTTVSLMGPF